MNKKDKNYHVERGSAILWILVAVGLFAALNFAFNSSSRTSTSLLSESEAEAYANQIIQYGNEVKQTVKRLQLRGCSDTEISFENDVISGYENLNAPDDGSCDVFNITGGGLSWKVPDRSMLDSSQNGSNNFGQYFFANTIQIQDIGTTCSTSDCTDLTMHIPHIKKNVCAAINKRLNIESDLNNAESVTNMIYTDIYKFKGNYGFITSSNTSTIGDEGGTDMPAGKNNGCIYRGGWTTGANAPYTYFHALIAR